jgi:Co/Zn/Cd efflux system component
MFENKRQPLASRQVYYQRMMKNLFIGCGIIFMCLMIGVVGYHFTASIPWLDSLHNASMILSGMGPVVDIKTVAGKWFSSVYALFSGVVFITNIGFILAPAIHRFFHQLHLETPN